jgi:hypothetical protein
MTIMAQYVVHDGARWTVIAETTIDDAPAFELERAIPRRPGQGKWEKRRIVARATECPPWVRQAGRRVVRGLTEHRGRIVIMEIRQGKGATLIALRQKGKRTKYELTLEGVFDLAAQSAAKVAMSDRKWRREQRALGRQR